MAYRDLRDFMAQLEATGDLRRVGESVSRHLEMTALRARAQHAPAECGHLQVGRAAFAHSAPVAGGSELGHEIAQVAESHGVSEAMSEIGS